MRLFLQSRIVERFYAVEFRAGARDDGVGRAVIGIGGLHQVIALRHAEDDVAKMRIERVAHEAGRARIIGIGEALAELLGEEFGDLVLEAFALIVGKGKIVRIGAHAQRLGIDEFDRTLVVVALGAEVRPHVLCEGRRRRKEDCGGVSPEKRSQAAPSMFEADHAIVSTPFTSEPCTRPRPWRRLRGDPLSCPDGRARSRRSRARADRHIGRRYSRRRSCCRRKPA